MQSRVGKIFVFSSFCISKCEGCQFVNPGLAGLSHLNRETEARGNTRFSRVGFWAKCHPETAVRCQNARFRFVPCTEFGAPVRKKQGSCIHLPDGFGTGSSPDNSEKPFSGLLFPSFSRPKNVFHELCPFLCGEIFFAFKRLKNHSLEIKC